MPLYEFECKDCGQFADFRALADRDIPAPCPHCKKASPRVFSTLNLAVMSPGKRMAHERNEQSRHAPHVCGSGCSHSKPKSSKPTRGRGEPQPLQLSLKKNSRPWMLGH